MIVRISPLDIVTDVFESKKGQTITKREGRFNVRDKEGKSISYEVIYHTTNCPVSSKHNNSDSNPSLSYWELENDYGEKTVNFSCKAGCTRQEILQSLGITFNSVPMLATENKKGQPYVTLEGMAEYTKLDFSFLTGVLNWHEGRLPYHSSKGAIYHERGVIIPFYEQDWSQFHRCKIRLRYDKRRYEENKLPYLWSEGDGEQLAYGWQFLDMATEADYLCPLEGETDFATLNFHGFPALGLPGAKAFHTLDVERVKHISRIYISQELTDEAGKEFPFALQRHLLEGGYTGQILRIPLLRMTGCKDPNELHKKLYPQMVKEKSNRLFREKFQQCLDNAVPLDYDTREAAIEEAKKSEPLQGKAEGDDQIKVQDKIVAGMYTWTNHGMFAEIWDKRKERFDTIALSNFGAQIASDIMIDDGAESKRMYEIQAIVHKRTYTFEIPAKEYTSLDWVHERLGSKAVITAGQMIKSHFCNAVQETSDAIEAFYYAHTGWRKVDGRMVYLHHGGCITESTESTETSEKNRVDSLLTTDNPASQANLYTSESTESTESTNSYKGVKVKLTGALENYRLEKGSISVQEAIRASLKFIDVAPDTITMPLYASLWRSILPNVNYGIHIAGKTGLGKSAIVALVQQHFGRLMDDNKFPSCWEDTENDLEAKLFKIKDAVIVIDEFKPKGSSIDQKRLHNKADRVFRSIGNGSARGRLDSQLNERPLRRPRGLVISTGEDTPEGASLRARGVMLTMDTRITTGEAARRLKEVQKEARKGTYETAMYAYIEWLAPQIADIETNMREMIEDKRDSLQYKGHARLNTNTANMLIGFETFLRFAQDYQAITPEQSVILYQRCVSALNKIAGEATDDNADCQPSEQYRRLIVAALRAKTAHFITLDGDNPGTAYGWKKSERVTTNYNGESIVDETYSACGDLIGAIDGDDIYLIPGPAYKAASQMGTSISDNITTSEATLRKFIFQDGMLATNSMHLKDKPRMTVRKRICKVQEHVLHFKASVLFGVDDETPNPDNTDETPDVTLPSNLVDSVDSAPCNASSQESSEVSPLKKTSGLSGLTDDSSGLSTLEMARKIYEDVCSRPGYGLSFRDGGIVIQAPSDEEFQGVAQEIDALSDDVYTELATLLRK